MPCYVDEIREYPADTIVARRCGVRWCHLWADTPGELYSMAGNLGLRKEWLQSAGGFLHYDLVPSKRALAVRYGAIESGVPPRILENRRALGQLPGRTLKALSLWQPWASLVAWGEKHYETRDWPTEHRGPLLIHATKGFHREASKVCFEQPFRDALGAHGIDVDAPVDETTGLEPLPLGKLVCVVDLVNCQEAMVVAPRLSHKEIAFGGYLPNRFAFELVNPRPLQPPIPIRQGKQGLWELSQLELAEVLSQVDLDVQPLPSSA